MKVVFPHQKDPGDSGTGISYYSSFAACPRKGNLNKEHGSAQREPLLTGNFYHMLLEHYYKQTDFSLKAMKQAFYETDSSELEGKCWATAVELFRYYRREFPADEFTILGVEQSFATDDPTIVGVAPYTCRFDLLVSISAEQVKEIKKRRGIDVEPGMYIIDHKTAGFFTENTILEYRHSYQFIAYQLAAQSIYPELKGLIVNVAVKKKFPEFHSLLLQLPDKVQKQALRRFLQIAQQREKGPDITIPTPEACFSKYGACEFLKNGMCRRI